MQIHLLPFHVYLDFRVLEEWLVYGAFYILEKDELFLNRTWILFARLPPVVVYLLLSSREHGIGVFRLRGTGATVLYRQIKGGGREAAV